MDEKLSIKTNNCEFVIAGRRDQQGKQYFTFVCDDFEVKLSSIDSVLDLCRNNAFGFIRK